MTLLISTLAAVITTIIWYSKAPDQTWKLSVLCFMYWGASLMWLVDAIVGYFDFGVEIFAPDAYTLLNDIFLGVSAVVLGLVVWVIILLVKDPKGVMRLSRRN